MLLPTLHRCLFFWTTNTVLLGCSGRLRVRDWLWCTKRTGGGGGAASRAGAPRRRNSYIEEFSSEDMKFEVATMTKKIKQVSEDTNKLLGYADFTTIKLAVQSQVKENNVALEEAEQGDDAVKNEVKWLLDG